VNAAHPGDCVLVAAGDYHESPASGVGVRVTVPDVVIEGVDRNTGKGGLTSRRCQATFPLTSRLDTIEMRNSVRELRTERGLSQGQLATAMSVSRQTINSIEQERYTPSLPLALALARYFETTVEDMFDGKHPAHNEGDSR
jgi:putative transcriptional regulator